MGQSTQDQWCQKFLVPTGASQTPSNKLGPADADESLGQSPHQLFQGQRVTTLANEQDQVNETTWAGLKITNTANKCVAPLWGFIRFFG